MKIAKTLKKLKDKYTNMMNNPLLYPLFDFFSAIFPAVSKEENAKRLKDRAEAINENCGAPLCHKPALQNGHLDRDKILLGTAVFYYDEHFTEKDVKRIADAGFDFIVTDTRSDEWGTLSDSCEKNRLAIISADKYLPIGGQMKDFDESVFDGYRKHPAQVGNMGWDEPNAENFKYIAKYAAAYKKALPEQFLFNNLFPGGATKKQLGTKSYREYIDRFSEEIGADYLSMDIYPFHPLKIMNKISMKICLDTYHTLGNACRRDKKDFWLYIQTQGKWFSHFYALPTYEQIKWQVWTSLCYGARSIIHVAYTPVWDNEAYAMLDKNGNLTEQYLYAKRINAEIIRLSDILKDYRSLGTAAAKSGKTNPHFAAALKKQEKNNRETGFYGIPEIKNIVSESTALAGYFEKEHGDGKAVLIVNCKDVYKSGAAQKVRIEFAGTVEAAVYEHGEKIREIRTRELELNIGSCDGTFVTFRNV